MAKNNNLSLYFKVKTKAEEALAILNSLYSTLGEGVKYDRWALLQETKDSDYFFASPKEDEEFDALDWRTALKDVGLETSYDEKEWSPDWANNGDM